MPFRLHLRSTLPRRSTLARRATFFILSAHDCSFGDPGEAGEAGEPGPTSAPAHALFAPFAPHVAAASSTNNGDGPRNNRFNSLAAKLSTPTYHLQCQQETENRFVSFEEATTHRSEHFLRRLLDQSVDTLLHLSLDIAGFVICTRTSCRSRRRPGDRVQEQPLNRAQRPLIHVIHTS